MDESELSELIDLASELSEILIQQPQILQDAEVKWESPIEQFPDTLRSAIRSKDMVALTFIRNICENTFECVKALYWHEGEKDRHKRRVVALTCWQFQRVDEIIDTILKTKQLN